MLRGKGDAMEIMFVSSEVAPFAKAGGLADVSHDLPKALAALGHSVSIVTPKHRGSEIRGELRSLQQKISVTMTWKKEEAEIFASEIEGGVKVYLVGKDAYYDRQGIYGNAYGDYEDNAERFIFFSRSVLELCLALGLKPDVIHCNDWETALVPVYLKSLYRDVGPLSDAATVFTVHNLGAQGIFWVYDLSLTGLGWEYFTTETLEFYGNLNLIKGGLVFADQLTTVSPTYAREILTPELGFGLQGVITKRRNDLTPILNGVDYEVWDPRRDIHIAAPYGPDNLEPKNACREDLQRRFNLNRQKTGPVIGIVSRLLDRKGLDLVSVVFDRMLDMGVQFVIMGMGEDKYHNFFQEKARLRPEDVALAISYDEAAAHHIEAGADIFLMPSRYEPCGLDQLYGLRYGTVPIVRATGGLDDTVEDYDHDSKSGTGFKFADYTPEALFEAFQRALSVYADAEEWRNLMRSGMKKEFSWKKPAEQYLDVYARAMNRRLASG